MFGQRSAAAVVPVLLMMGACSADGAGDAPRGSGERVGVTEGGLDRSVFFAPLVRTCRDANTAGARTSYDALNDVCTCPDTGNRAAFVVGGVGVGQRGCRTANVVTSNECASTPNGYTAALGDGSQSGRDALARCLDAPLGLTDPDETDPLAYYGIRVQDPSIRGSAQIATLVATWADANLGIGSPLRLNVARGLWQPDISTVHVGKPLDSELDAAIGEALSVEFRERDMAYSPVYFEPDPSALEFIFTRDATDGQKIGGEGAAPPLFKKPQLGQNEKDLYWAYRTFTVDRADPLNFGLGEAVHGDGCAGTCKVTTEAYPLADENNMPLGATARLERVYSFGSVLREAIWVERNGIKEGMILLAPSGLPGLILSFTQNLASDRQGMTLDAYDRQWNALGHRTYTLSPSISEIASHATGGLPAASHGLGLCEASAVSYLTATDLKTKLSRGPSIPDFAQGTGSAFGWYDNIGGSLELYAPGVRNTTLGFYPRPERDDHAARVARVATSIFKDSDNARLLPLGGEECFTHFSDWNPTVSTACNDAPCARVINVSSAFKRWKQDCDAVAGPAISASNGSLLWVVGSGNGGTNGKGRDTPVDQCPQSLTGASNLVVVAAASGSGTLMGYSDYGAQYADLAASGDATDGSGDVGTSFAAPRVAAVATEMAIQNASLNPPLSPSEMRLALLASVAGSWDLKGKVRSGGMLDRDKALAMATCLGKKRSISDVTSRVKKCMDDGHFDSATRDDRIRQLTNNGVKFQ